MIGSHMLIRLLESNINLELQNWLDYAFDTWCLKLETGKYLVIASRCSDFDETYTIGKVLISCIQIHWNCWYWLDKLDWKHCLTDCCSKLEFTYTVITWNGVLRLHPYLNSCARTHTRNWPVTISGAELELELDTIGANLLHMCEDSGSSHQTKQTINLDDAVELRSILNKTPRPTRPINIQNVSLLGRTVNKLQLERQRPWALLVEGDHNAWHNISADTRPSRPTINTSATTSGDSNDVAHQYLNKLDLLS